MKHVQKCIFTRGASAISKMLLSPIRILIDKIPVIGKGNHAPVFFHWLKIRGDINRIEIARTARFNGRIFIYGSSNVIIVEDNVIFKSGKIWIEDNGGRIIIKKGTTIEDAEFASVEGKQIECGEDCMISSGVRIVTSDSHSIIGVESGKRLNKPGDVTIGNHVWIGNRVAIHKGVKIDDNVVIGACSLVTNDAPSNTVIAGIPARVIRNGITWKRERIQVFE